MHPKDPRNSFPSTTRQQSFSWFHCWLLHSFVGFKPIFKTLSLHPGLTQRVVVVSIVSIRALQTIYLAKCEFAWTWWQIHWKKCADKAGLQRLHLSKEELSPGPGFGDAFDLPEPSSRPYCWFSSLSKYCQINYQGRGQCSTESFLLYNYLEEKDFLNYPNSPESKHELLKNTQISDDKYITFTLQKYWFSVFIFGNGALRAMEVSA